MKVLHVITGLSKKSGGPARSSQGLVAALCKAGVDAWIWALDGSSPWLPGVKDASSLFPNSSFLFPSFDNSIRSILFHTKFRGPLKVLVLERLADILRNAVLYNKGRDDDEVFYNLAHRLQFDPGDGSAIKEFIARLIVKETPDGNRTWTVEFSNKKELTGMPTTGEAATVEVTRLKSPSTYNILKTIYAVNGAPRRVLFVSRMHPKKGVQELVEAWAKMKGVGSRSGE